MTSEFRSTILARAGFRCEKCGGPLNIHSLHHRRPRGMGGSRNPAISGAANFLALCGTGTTGCHGWVESNRTTAYLRGLLLRTGSDPTATPYVDDRGHWWLLLDDATRHRITMPQ